MDIKQGIRRNFARRVASYDEHAGVQRFMAQQLLAQAESSVLQSGRILEIGCGTGYFTRLLREANCSAWLVSLDLDPALVAAARRRLGEDPGVAWLVADGENFGRGCFDMIVANAAFQWLTHPGNTLAVYYRHLHPGGVLAFSTLGPRTFQELAASWQQAARALQLPVPPMIPAQNFLDQGAWTAHLTQAGFQEVRMTQETMTVTFPSVRHFLKTLQATGATNPRPRAFSSRLLKALTAAYTAGYAMNGSIPATYDIIWAMARKGGEMAK